MRPTPPPRTGPAQLIPKQKALTRTRRKRVWIWTSCASAVTGTTGTVPSIDRPFVNFVCLTRHLAHLKTNMSKTKQAPALQLPDGPFSGYIFDCDGTLADSMPPHYRAWLEAFRKHGAKFEFTWELFYSMAGTGLHDSVKILNKRFGDTLDPEAVVNTQSAYLEAAFEHMLPIEPVVMLARELAKTDPVSVASGGGRHHVLSTLRVIGMEDFFKVIVTKDDVVHSKPHPETFLKAAELMGVPAGECLVFEDSKLGLQAAESAGMRWVYIEPDLYSAGAGI